LILPANRCDKAFSAGGGSAFDYGALSMQAADAAAEGVAGTPFAEVFSQRILESLQ
jgi:CubicO group peptidase (beta-lactamase class C family)